MSISPEHNQPQPEAVGNRNSSDSVHDEYKEWWHDIPEVNPALEPDDGQPHGCSIGKAGMEDVEFSEDALGLYDLLRYDGNPKEFIKWWAEKENIDLGEAAAELKRHGLLEATKYSIRVVRKRL